MEIDIEDDGLVMVTGVNPDNTAKAVDWIKNIVREVEAGEIFDGTVTRIMDFGAFVEVLPKQEGLVHISEIAPERIDKVTDVLNVGDKVKVIVKEIDDLGRINLSIKRLDPDWETKSRAANANGNHNAGFGHAGHRRPGPDRRGGPDRGPRRPRF